MALGWSTRDSHSQLPLFCCKVFLSHRKSHRSMENITSPSIRDQLKLTWRDTAGQSVVGASSEGSSGVDFG